MFPDNVIQYQEELKITALKILKDPYLAQDMVQDAFLFAFENGIHEKQKLLEVVRSKSRATFAERTREPETLQTASFDCSEGLTEEMIWTNRRPDAGELLVTSFGEVEHALFSTSHFRGKFIPFPQAREFVQSLELKTSEAWKSYKRKHPQISIPSCPAEVYKQEWQGWRNFLGIDFLTYEEFLAFARTVLIKEGVNSPRKFKAYHRNLPKHIPSNPNQIYKDQWTGWGHVFNSKRKKAGKILSYHEARKYVQTHFTPNGIDTLVKYKHCKLPDFLPVAPHTHYKANGWVDSSDFFGTNKEKVGLKKNHLPYKEAREWVRLNLRIFGITTGALYIKYVKGTLDIPGLPPVPAGLPSSPASYYRAESFTWGDFLGTLKIDAKKKNLYTYKQCKAWNKQNLSRQIKGQAEWQQYKNGKRPDLPPYPSQMPLAPFKRFTERGEWVSWEDFLNLPPKPVYLSHEDHKSRKKGKKDFWTYAEARQYMIDVIVPSGIKTLDGYLALEKKPANIPLDPKDYYEGKGWVNVAHFMGLEKNYLSYAEAKEWVKTNFLPKGINAYYLYRKNTSLLPDNMPPAPHRYYKNNGWVDVYDFMGRKDPESKRLANPPRIRMSIEEARVWIKTNLPEVDSYEKWLQYRQGRIKHLPELHPGIPKLPHITYGRQHVWKGWSAFFAPLTQAA